ncbi:MAG TPA: ribosome small subunit-dependent GTPase A [Thermoanaerobaculia bacterium]|nr:ribosome small subunit-dependent GTPase A [Thermoanaerobaculia bacterium]
MQRNLAEHRADHATQKARKEAGKLRRAFNKDKGGERGGAVTEENWEALLDQHGVTRKRSKLTRIIAQLEPQADAGNPESDVDPSSAAIVMSVTGGECRVFRDGVELDCKVPPHIAMRRGSALAAGDRVILSGDTVETVLPRQSVLARPDPINKHLQRMIAANIDVVVHVVSVKSPPLRPRLIDRYLIAIQRGGAQPVLCVNKVDLLSDDEREAELAKLTPYRDLEVPVIAVSTKSGEGLDALRSEVEGRMAALVGHSGVGKSSILNALDERLQLATRGLHRRGTGRHTTTRATLYDFGAGTYLIDTPGIREFGLWDLDRESLRDYFPEFVEPAESCRFTNCSHVHEPDCEVKRRVEAGELNRARYETYARLYESLA